MRTTRAVRIAEHGGPEVLTWGEYPLAELGPTDVLVEVAAASVSYWDVKYRRGLPPALRLPGRGAFALPQQLGREAAGVVLAVGEQVQSLAPGDRVVGVTHPENPASREAVRGLGNLSQGVALPGHQALGGYAEHLARDQDMWLRVADGVELEQAALALWPFATSHRVLIDRLGVRPGDTVVVAGAAGGMGLATVQLARLAGARVVGTTRSAAKVEALLELGADAVVVTADRERARAELRDAVGPYGAEHAVDYTGDHPTLAGLLDALGLGGRLVVSSGEQDGSPLPLRAADLVRGELTVLGIRGARANDQRVALALLERGQVHVPVAARFPLREAAAAHAWLETSPDRVGRVVLVT